MGYNILNHHPAELAWNLGFRRFSGLPILLEKSRKYFFNPVFDCPQKNVLQFTYLQSAVSALGNANSEFPLSITVKLSEKEFVEYKDTIRQLINANTLYVGTFYYELGRSIQHRSNCPSFVNHLKQIIPERIKSSSDLQHFSVDEFFNITQLRIKNIGYQVQDAGSYFLRAHESENSAKQ